MRKFAIIVLSVIALSSCMGRDGLDGRDGRDGLGVADVIMIDVPASSWSKTTYENSNYYFATVDVPEITSDVYMNGLVTVYAFSPETGAQTAMPFDSQFEWFDDLGQKFVYTEHFTFEYDAFKPNVGANLTIIYSVSDFAYNDDPSLAPGEMHFRCVVMR